MSETQQRDYPEYTCTNCGSGDVHVAMWVDPNTLEVFDDFGSWGEQDSQFCNNCGENGTVYILADPKDIDAARAKYAEGEES